MAVLVLFLIVPLLSIGLALAFYSRRLQLKRGAWLFLLFFTLLCGSLRWWIGFFVPLLSCAFLVYLVFSDNTIDDDQRWSRLWECLKIK